MPWNNGGPGPWGSPGGDAGGQGGGSGKGNQGGDGGQRPGGPWGGGNGPRGNGPRGNGGGGRGPNGLPPLPDIDELISRVQEQFRRAVSGRPRGRPPGGGMGGGFWAGGRGLAVLALVLVVVWLASGFYRVQPDEQGIVLRFGAYDRSTLPGLNYHVPWPVESVIRPAVTHINRIEIGYRSSTDSTRIETGRDRGGREVLAESLMLTGDENIVDIDFAVFWRISDPVAYLFNTRTPPVNVKAVAESAMREVIGRTPIQPALTELRLQIEQQVARETQNILNQYKAGVEITQVQLQKVDPPAEVIDSFRDVQRANTDAERIRNEAEAYRNDIVPRARGDASRVVAEAEGARQASVAEATGQTQRFLSVLAAYQQAREITLKRLYLETMQDIIAHNRALIVDEGLKGVLPVLSLGDPGGGTGPAPALPGVPPSQAPTPSTTSGPRAPVQGAQR
jgi:membrane protease subunit HflK